MDRSGVPAPSALRTRYDQRSTRQTALRNVRESLVSLAGLVGRPVLDQAGDRAGTVGDVVARWHPGTSGYPPVTGLVMRLGHRRLWLPIGRVADISHEQVALLSSQIDLRDFARRPGETELYHDVVDHQLVDTDGARVVRASDLYLAPVAGAWQLVGVDVGYASLLRRLGPARWRTRPTPDKVIDWGGIHSFGDDAGPGGKLQASGEGLRRLHPGELADLLEDLGRSERQALLSELTPGQAADALEEMEPDELAQLLRESDLSDAGALLGAMEPDEAAEALRELDAAERDELLAAMPGDTEHQVRSLLDYRADSAGGIMTSLLVTVTPEETVSAVRDRLLGLRHHADDLGGVVVVDDRGGLVDDLTLTELFLAEPDQRVHDLIGPPWPITVPTGADVEQIGEALTRSRRPSVVVVDGEGRPQGRILADDVIDALVGERGRFRFPRRLA